jgi:hypothetical protein
MSASLPKGKNILPVKEEDEWAPESVLKLWRKRNSFPLRESNRESFRHTVQALQRMDKIKFLLKIRNKEEISWSRFIWLKTEASGELL